MKYKLNSLCDGLFKVPKTTIISKIFRNMKNGYFVELSFWNFLKCLITSWFEIGNGKDVNFNKYLYLESNFNYNMTLKMDFNLLKMGHLNVLPPL